MREKLKSIVLVLLILAIISGIINEIKYRRDKKKEEIFETTEMEETISDVDTYSYNDIEYLVYYLAADSEMQEAFSRLVDPLGKSEPVTKYYVNQVVEIVGADEEIASEELKDLKDEDAVSKEKFDLIYDEIVSSGVVEGLCRDTFFVYEIKLPETALEQNIIVTDGTNNLGLTKEISADYYSENGELSAEIFKDYEDKILDIYRKDDMIIRINDYAEEETYIIKNVWIIDSSGTGCTFLYNDLKKNYAYSGGNAPKECVADLVVSNQGIVDFVPHMDVLDCQIEDVSDDGIRVKNKATYPYNEYFRIYDIYRDARCEKSIPVLTGYTNLKLIVVDGVAQAAIVDSELVSDKIRVILSDNNFSSYKQEQVELTCNTAFEISYPDDSTAVYEANTKAVIDYQDYDKGDVITVKPREYEGRLQILSLTRECGNPIYRGTLELDINKDCMYVINELSLEEYLYSVVSSEMPTSNPDEALKAMAICARGYAYSKMNDGSYSDYHAHLDDSSLCQVYNNVAETESTIQAVKDTYSIVPTYEDDVIVSLYFSTSGGTTCTNDEIWGGAAYPYLESNLETLEKESVDLSSEEDFEQFISNSMGKDIIDSEMPYYRWSITFTEDEMTEAINATLQDRIEMSPDNFRIRNENGEFVAKNIVDIGDVKSVHVTERSVSGVVQKLEIVGGVATMEVSGQSNIRTLITPVNQNIVRQDGSVTTGWTSLPSPFYYVEKTEDGYVIYGGGFGHGAGMSQNGAKVLAEQGYKYKYILRHYYSFIDFTPIYTVEAESEE